MTTHSTFSLLQTLATLANNQTVYRSGARKHGTVYHPTTGRVVGYNFGSSVRPEVARIAVSPVGDETVASFLARGGTITVGRSRLAKGALLVRTIKIATKGGHNRTGQIVRRAVTPQTITSSSVVSLAREQRPYNGSAMKMFGPTN